MYPDNYKYTKEHEWVKISGTTATIGITSQVKDARGRVGRAAISGIQVIDRSDGR